METPTKDWRCTDGPIIQDIEKSSTSWSFRLVNCDAEKEDLGREKGSRLASRRNVHARWFFWTHSD